MNPRRQNLLTIIRIVTDLTMVSLGWILAFQLRFFGGFSVEKGIPSSGLYLKLIPFIVVIWFVVLTAFGFYRRSNRHRSAMIEALDILQSTALATVAFIAFTYFYEEYRYSRLVLLLFLAIHPFLLIFGRSFVRKALRIYRQRAAPRRTLIVGGGEFLDTAIAMSREGDVSSSDLAGVILAGDEAQILDGQKICSARGLRVLPMPTDWTVFFMENAIQTVVIALPYKSFGWIEDHLEKIADQVSDVKLLPDLMKFTRLAAGIELISGVPVISIHDSPLAGVQGVIKRAVDIVGSIVALVLFGPLMFLLGIAVKLSSPGPVFYAQERMGLDGNTFFMYKFRSMPVNAEKDSGAVFATKVDTRATPLGRLLRKTSLDELPQFFNVLKGDMSLVGPRPERPVFVNDFRRKIPGYFLRHKVRAGITGWAQVNGWRGDTSIEKRIECDLYYIQNWTLWFDIKIILLTIVRGFIHKNAY